MKSKIYILEKASRAMNYGIGTYVKQLTNCLLSSKMDFCVIHLYADCLETTIIDKGGYEKTLIQVKKKLSSNYNQEIIKLIYEKL